MRIFWRLLICFILIGFLPLSFMTLLSYKKSEEQIQDELFLSLSEILKSRIKTLTAYFKDLENSAELVAKSQNVLDFFKNAEKDLNPQQESFFKEYSSLFNLEDIFIVSKKGKIFYSSKEKYVNTDIFKQTQLADLFQKVLSKNQPYITPLLDEFIDGIPGIFIGVPISSQGVMEGILAIRVSVEKIYEIFHDYTYLKNTGEVLIAIKKNDTVLFVNPIRHKPDSAFNFSVKLGSNIALPMQSAVQKVAGKGLSIDYRDEKIIAVWDYFPLLGTGIVVKLDQDEAFEPLKALETILIYTGLGALLLILILAVLLSNWLAKPIVKLQEVANEIGQGKLDIVIPVDSHDEFGDLGRSLKQMTESLKKSTASIDDLNKEIKEKEKLEQMRAEMLSRVSHELRTPLGPIKEGVNLVLEGQLLPNQKEMLELVQKNTIRLETLIESVLQFQRLVTREETFHFSKENINTLVQEVANSYARDIQTKQLKLHLELDPKLPQIYCDKTQIKNVIDILLDNAIKFTDRGSIWIKSESQENKIKISVKDEGIGISKEDLEKLFQGFRELNIKSDEKKQGIGLDLVKAKCIIENHEGYIGADSSLNQGSNFYFVIPIKQKEKSE